MLEGLNQREEGGEGLFGGGKLSDEIEGSERDPVPTSMTTTNLNGHLLPSPSTTSLIIPLTHLAAGTSFHPGSFKLSFIMSASHPTHAQTTAHTANVPIAPLYLLVNCLPLQLHRLSRLPQVLPLGSSFGSGSAIVVRTIESSTRRATS